MLCMEPQLILRSKQGDRLIPLINTSAWTIGRSEDSTIVLEDTWASRNHAIIQIMELQFYLIDLGSLNGTFLNGKRVNIPMVLNNGDEITFGTTNSQIFLQQLEVLPVTVSKQKSTFMLYNRQLITVLVVDIRDFTVLTRKLEEQVLSQVIGTWFRKATEIIDKHGSWVDKYIGDAVMAVWVHKKVNEEIKVDPQEMMQVIKSLYALYKMSEDLNNQFSLPFQLRIGAGLNTGTATLGQIGAGNRPEYTALGDTVNSTFRLESVTKEIGMDIALGESTFNLCPHSHLLPLSQQKVMLKGYELHTDIYAGKFTDIEIFLDQVPQL
jgi:adenylate cyclase